MNDEETRLASLYSLNILDTEADPNLDELTKLASNIAGTPIALVSLIDEKRQWFKSRVGLDASETPRDVAFCHHAILQDEIFEVEDSREDETFKNNPLVTGQPHVIFYAGMPLKMEDGSNIGTLCVIGNKPQKLTEAQREQLKIIGNQAIKNIELNHKVCLQNRISQMLKRLHRLSYQESEHFDDLVKQYIKTGCELFGMEFGIQSHIDGDEYIVESVCSPNDALLAGTKFVCKETFCQAVIEAKKTVTYLDVSKLKHLKGHPCHANMNLHSYISTPIWVNDKIYGTLSFSSTLSRKTNFSNEEIAFFEIMADLISKKIQFREQKEYSNYAFEIMNKAPEFIGIADASTGKALYHNEALNKISGKIGRDKLHISKFHPKWAEEKVSKIGIPTAKEQGSWTGESAIFDQSGKEVPVLQTIVAHFDEQKRFKYVSTIMQDITVQKEIEHNLIESREKAIQASKSKSEFLANISHEIRTPMNGILGTLELLNDSELTKDQSEYVQTIKHCGDGLLSIINNVLDLSKIEAGKLEIEKIDFDLEQAVIETYDFFKFKIKEKGLSYKINYPLGIPKYVNGDVTKIKQVLLNFISNSLKFTHEGGIVIEIAAPREGSINFTVKDSGIGIDEGNLTEIFESFSQADASTSRKFGGTGLGLSICSSLVEAMGGEVFLESELGVGSSFSFSLDLKEVSKIKKPEENSQKDYSSTPRLNSSILVVEDNSVNQKIAMAFLNKLGHQADLANNGKEALELCQKKNYGLIFMDIQMPLMDGYEATKLILELMKNSPPEIIALTANVFEEDKKRCIEAGMSGFLSKPFSIKDFEKILIEKVKKAA